GFRPPKPPYYCLCSRFRFTIVLRTGKNAAPILRAASTYFRPKLHERGCPLLRRHWQGFSLKASRKVPFVRNHRLLSVATLALAVFGGQQTYAQSKLSTPAGSDDKSTPASDRASAYYHYALAHSYEEMA